MKKSFFRNLFLALVVTTVCSGCERGPRKRPPGYIRLGPVPNFLEATTFLPEKRLYLRRDQIGWYVMSTLCTYDGSPLKKETNDNRTLFRSTYTTSLYNEKGEVLQGPTKHRLPYYELVVDSAKYGGPKNTLYVRIGVDQGPTWRLPVPKVFATAQQVQAAPAP